MFTTVLGKRNHHPGLPSLNQPQKIHYTLRIASAMCFIGHGAFGIITKSIWCNYFAVFGIDHNLAYRLMPVLGSFDIMMGLLILVYPMRMILLWLIIWGTITAALRPISGEPFAEFIERSGNFGAPLALLILSGSGGNHISGWFKKIDPNAFFHPKNLWVATNCLKIVVFLLILGHGWLNVIGKKGLLGQYNSIGFPNPGLTAEVIGLLEIAASFAVLLRPVRPLVIVLFIWKVTSELFYPHHELFEWIERGGSYGALLALWFSLEQSPAEKLRLVEKN